MFNIQTLDKISPQGLKKFSPTKYVVGPALDTPDVILVRSHNLFNYDFPASLKAVGRAGIGVDNIPVEVLTQKGIPVFYTPGANANAVKELVIAGLFLGCRTIDAGRDFVKQLTGNDEEIMKRVEAQKKQFVGIEIFGKTLAVIGLGHIGVKVANTALALGMRVLGYDPQMTLENALALSPGVEKVSHLEEALSHAEFITLHVPLSPSTRHLINHENVTIFSDNTVLLNFSRADIVESDAIIEALNNKKLRAYVTDFPKANFKDHPNAICLPHLGACTEEAEENCAHDIVESIKCFLQSGEIKNSVNFPNVSLPWNTQISQSRLAITNDNTPGVIAAISQLISSAGHNINHMINQSRGNVAYNLIDINGMANAGLINKISTISGVLKAYCIVKD